MRQNDLVAYHTLAYMSRLARILRPKKRIGLCEWAEANIVLPEGSSISGHYSADVAPFQREILNAISDPAVHDVSIMSSAQVGKTTIILCGIGYFILFEPSYQMVVFPTLVLSERFSKTRLAQMIRDCPGLRQVVAPVKTRDSDNTILLKQYAGGHIVLAGANSPSSLSEMPARIVWMDEVDRFSESAGNEGDPVELAEKRTTTFWNAKHIKTSTPTVAGDSTIETEYLEGTMEEWCVKCPCCGTFQPYEFSRVLFKDVAMVCMECGEIISESDWKESDHKWVAAHPERKGYRSFHLNELTSPWRQWKSIIQEYKKAYKKYKKFNDPTKLQVFVNTVLGKTWDESEYAEVRVTDDQLRERAEYYPAEIPDDVIVLTAAVDVQGNRFEVEIRGWSRGFETWGIRKTEIYGNLEQNEVWNELEGYLAQPLRFRDGRCLNLAAKAIDVGGNHSDMTIRWLKYMQQKGENVYGVKGYANREDIPLVYKETEQNVYKRLPNGKKVVVASAKIQLLGVNAGKDAIHHRLGITKPGEGYCHFPSNEGLGYDSDYYKGIFAEHKKTVSVNGRRKTKWIKKPGVRNEPLDLLNYNFAACMILDPDWDILERKLAQGLNYMQKAAAGRRVVRRRCVNKGIEV